MRYTYVGKCMYCPFCEDGICVEADEFIPISVGWSHEKVYRTPGANVPPNCVPTFCPLLECYPRNGHVMGFKLATVLQPRQSRALCEFVYDKDGKLKKKIPPGYLPIGEIA